MSATVVISTLGVAALLGVVLPWVAMRMLVPSLRKGPTAENYRGDSVFLGLGVVWLIWSGAAVAGGTVFAVLGSDASVLPILLLAGLLSLVVFAFGLVDDAYGTGASRGFRGHLRELRRGRLTTGGLKLFGISVASYAVSVVLAPVSMGEDVGGLAYILALPAGAAIALTSNFVNLTDLRPGRALKVYTVLAVAGILSTVLLLGHGAGASVTSEPARTALDLAALGLFVLGPVVAVYRYDFGGLGMLGDAGANPMGAVAGMLVVVGLPLWALGVYLVLMLALNLASERISFSRVIERNPLLSWLDMLGRGAQETEMHNSEKSSPQDGARPK